jgi:hypothetical protein
MMVKLLHKRSFITHITLISLNGENTGEKTGDITEEIIGENTGEITNGINILRYVI